MGFNDSVIDEIKNRCNIVDVIGREVVLKKAGNNYKGLCPFHNEKTPSFTVSEDKQIFTCFGCGASGDVIEFVKLYNNLDFHEAIEKIASDFGINIEKTGYVSEGNKSAMYEINRQAALYFYKSFSNKNNPAYEYMINRGLDPQILKKFGIGYADPNWDSLYNFFQSNNADIQLLLTLGLISKSKNKYFDKFRNRIMFPIINSREKIIGFGGRTLSDATPKYLNSPESLIFAKKNNLYGLNLTRQDINREDLAILVEGYMDVISLYMHGIKNVIASLGTALTHNQAAMIKRYTDNVVIAYDADEAGRAAALRGMEILYQAGCKVKILMLDDGKDPDEYIKKNGKKKFVELLNKAMPYVDYKIYLLKSKYNVNTTEGSLTFLKEVAIILKTLSPIEADIYIKKVASQSGVSEGAIRLEVYGKGYMDKSAPITLKKIDKQIKKEVKEDILSTLQKNLIKLALTNSSYIPKIEPYLDAFHDQVLYRIFQLIRSLYREDEDIDIKKLKDSLEENDIRQLDDIINTIQLADRENQVFNDCINHIKQISIKKREDEIIQLLSVLDDDKDRENILSLTNELMELQREKCRGDVRYGL